MVIAAHLGRVIKPTSPVVSETKTGSGQVCAKIVNIIHGYNSQQGALYLNTMLYYTMDLAF